MTNFSTEALRRVDMTFGIAYWEDVSSAKALVRGLLDADPRILQEPEPFIAVSELADSSVNIVMRAWVEAGD